MCIRDSDNTAFVFNDIPAPSGSAVFLYNSVTHQLSYDADGNGAGAEVVIATLPSTVVALTLADIFFV